MLDVCGKINHNFERKIPVMFSLFQSGFDSLCGVGFAEGDAEVLPPGFDFAEILVVSGGGSVGTLCSFGESVQIVNEGFKVGVVKFYLVTKPMLDGLSESENEVHCGTVEVIRRYIRV